MSDDKPVEATAHQESVSDPTEHPPKQRWTDRLWGFKTVIAVALASVIIGGLGGAALANIGGSDGDDRRGPGFGHQFRGGPGQGRGPNGSGPPGQLKKQDRGPNGLGPPGQLKKQDRGDRGEPEDRDNS